MHTNLLLVHFSFTFKSFYKHATSRWRLRKNWTHTKFYVEFRKSFISSLVLFIYSHISFHFKTTQKLQTFQFFFSTLSSSNNYLLKYTIIIFICSDCREFCWVSLLFHVGTLAQKWRKLGNSLKTENSS
jgi:membrane protease YdiL (CAAX protease family)